MNWESMIQQLHDEIVVLEQKYLVAKGQEKRKLKRVLKDKRDELEKLVKEYKKALLAEKGIDSSADVTSMITGVVQGASSAIGSITGMKNNALNNKTEQMRIASRENVAEGRQSTIQKMSESNYIVIAVIGIGLLLIFKLFK